MYPFPFRFCILAMLYDISPSLTFTSMTISSFIHVAGGISTSATKWDLLTVSTVNITAKKADSPASSEQDQGQERLRPFSKTQAAEINSSHSNDRSASHISEVSPYNVYFSSFCVWFYFACLTHLVSKPYLIRQRLYNV